MSALPLNPSRFLLGPLHCNALTDPSAVAASPCSALHALLAAADSNKPSSFITPAQVIASSDGGRKLAEEPAGLTCERQWFGTVSGGCCHACSLPS